MILWLVLVDFQFFVAVCRLLSIRHSHCASFATGTPLVGPAKTDIQRTITRYRTFVAVDCMALQIIQITRLLNRLTQKKVYMFGTLRKEMCGQYSKLKY